MAASYDLPRLRDLLVKHFSLEELHTLAFDLGVDYESLGGAGKEARAREFLLYLDRRGRIPQLLDAVRRQRPEAMQEERQPEFPLVYSIRSYQYITGGMGRWRRWRGRWGRGQETGIR